jgi:redox-sensitive bicupin YhaK (pirin superfamily)
MKEEIEMTDKKPGIFNIQPLGFPWATRDPFLFCVYHADDYPKGNGEFGPDVPLTGRNLGNDFTLKDGWRMYHGKNVPGFPVHPHRGFETVTVVRKGVVDHSDSLGGAGRYRDGDVQWMTAGKGIQHAEMFPLIHTERSNPLELFQIWLNLPGAKKFVEPHYAMLWKESIPVFRAKDARGLETEVELVAGSLGEISAPDPAPDSWAAHPENEVAIWHVQMPSGATWSVPPASPEINRSLYFFSGDKVEVAGKTVASGYGMDLRADQAMNLVNGEKEGRFLLLQGRPILEPVVNYGPFVMNTKKEIQETYMDYQRTQFGGWPWSRPDQVHPVQKGRFALYSDGREEEPPASG